ncbi:S8 family serine peptidase [Persicobacter diffluens]
MAHLFRFALALYCLLITCNAMGQAQFSIDRPGQHFVPEATGMDFLQQKANTRQAAGEPQYIVMQFFTPPTQAEKAELAANGMSLKNYIGGNAYYVQLSSAQFRSSYTNKNIRTAFESNQLRKVAPQFLNDSLKTNTFDLVKKGMVHVIKDVPEAQVLSTFKEIGVQKVKRLKGFDLYEISFYENQLDQIASIDWLTTLMPLTPERKSLDITGQKMSGVMNGRRNYGGLRGTGINIGVWDTNVTDHTDLGSRVNANELEDHTNFHGMHVTGIMAGAGVINPAFEGMAPGAKVESWNFNVGRNGLREFEEMALSAKEKDIKITQNSYGYNNPLGVKFPYGPTEYGLDQVANDYTDLLHVFACGNSNRQKDREGSETYSTVSNSSKNMLSVANLDYTRALNWSSSYGPGHHGMLVPHVAALGTNVWSLHLYDKYASATGTSMACPLVSGGAAILMEYYKQQYGEQPAAALIKGLICNTAHDIAQPGPDYYSGFGEINVEKALKSIEFGRFEQGAVEQGEEWSYRFTIPSGLLEAKIMLSWLDPASIPTLGNPLVNDLDLEIHGPSGVQLPLVLDPLNPDFEAKAGVDRINNIEQVVLQQPAPGQYTIKVKGYSVPEGPQEFYVNMDYVESGLNWVYPFEGENLTSGANTLFRWNSTNHDAPTKLYFSANGEDYELLAEAAAGQMQAIAVLPDVVSDQMHLRLVQAGEVREVSGTIMGRVQELQVIREEGKPVLSWEMIRGASHYEVLKYETDSFQLYKKVAFDKFSLSLEEVTSGDWFAVRAIQESTGIKGLRSLAIQVEDAAPMTTLSWPITIDFESEEHRPYFQGLGNAKNGPFAQALYGVQDPEVFNSKILLLTGNTSIGNEAWVGATEIGDLENQVLNAKKAFENNQAFLSKAVLKVKVPEKINNPVVKFDLVLLSAYADATYFRLTVNGNPLSNTLGQSYFHRQSFADYDAWPEMNPNFRSVLKIEQPVFSLMAYKGQEVEIGFEAICRSMRATGGGDYYGAEVKIDNILLEDFVGGNNLKIDDFTRLVSGPGESSQEVEMQITNWGDMAAMSLDFKWELLDRQENVVSSYNEMVHQVIMPGFGYHHKFRRPVNMETVDESYQIRYSVTSNLGTVSETYGPVDRYGDYFRLGVKDFLGSLLSPKVNQELYITDLGGRIYNYDAGHAAGYPVAPKNQGKRIMLEVQELDLAEGDRLIILDGARYGIYEEHIVLDYVGGQDFELGQQVVSTTPSGQMTIIFISAELSEERQETAQGFVIKATEVPPMYTKDFSVESVRAGEWFYDYQSTLENKYRVSFTLGVSGSENLYEFDARYFVDGVQKGEAHFARSAGLDYNRTTSFTFMDDLLPALSPGEDYEITVELMVEDEVMENNRKTFVLKMENDPAPETLGEVYIAKASIGDFYFNENGGQPDQEFTNDQYGYQDFSDRMFHLEYGQKKELEVILDGYLAGAMKPVVFVDWNEDGYFSMEEKMRMYQDHDYDHRYYGYLEPERIGGAAGQKMMRITAMSEFFSGEMANDYRIELQGTPYNHDIRLDYLSAKHSIFQDEDLEVKIGVMQTIQPEEKADIVLQLFDELGRNHNDDYSFYYFDDTLKDITMEMFYETAFQIPSENFKWSGGKSMTLLATVSNKEDGYLNNNSASAPLKVLSKSQKNYLLASNGGILFRWDRKEPLKRDRLKLFDAKSKIISTTWASNFRPNVQPKLYGLSERTYLAAPMIFEIDPYNGAIIRLAEDSLAFKDLNLFEIAYSPKSDKLYAIGSSAGKYTMYRINTSDGTPELLIANLQMKAGTRYAGMDVDMDGTLYLLDAINNEIVTYSPDGNGGFLNEAKTYCVLERNLLSSQGVYFDRKDGHLYIYGNEVVQTAGGEDVVNRVFRLNEQGPKPKLEVLKDFSELDGKQLVGMTHVASESYIRATQHPRSFQVKGAYHTTIDHEKGNILIYLPEEVSEESVRLDFKLGNDGKFIDRSSGLVQSGQTVNLNRLRDNFIFLDFYGNIGHRSSEWISTLEPSSTLGPAGESARLASVPFNRGDGNLPASDNWAMHIFKGDFSNEFKRFDFLTMDNPALAQDVIGQISGQSIYLELPDGISPKSLVPAFDISEYKQVLVNGKLQQSAKNIVDFSAPVIYTVYDDLKEVYLDYMVFVNYAQNSAADLFTFGIAAEGQSDLESPIQAQIEGNEVQLDLSSLGQFESLYPYFTMSEGAELFYKGLSYPSDEHPFDFNHFDGFNIISEDGQQENSFTLKVKFFLSEAADLLRFALQAQYNESLQEDVEAEVEEGKIKMDLKSLLGAPLQLIPSFEVSEAASLMLDDAEVLSGETIINFSEVESLHVLAEDGQTYKTYQLEIDEHVLQVKPQISFARIYPNPVVDQLNVEVSGAFEWEIRDMAGRSQMKGTNRDRSALSLAPLSSGSYILTIIQGQKVNHFKILKQ